MASSWIPFRCLNMQGVARQVGKWFCVLSLAPNPLYALGLLCYHSWKSN